jgi:arabinan endo-1,5-alpha-L-arabinosidase
VKPTTLLAGFVLTWASPVFALDGQVQGQDPSTIMQCDGKYYTYGTGGTTLVSDDGWLRTLDGQGIPSI